MAFNEVGEVINNCQVSKKGIFHMQIRAPLIADAACPGQFLHIRTAEHKEPLLRRPMSIHGYSSADSRIEILYQVVGRGTEILKRKKRGTSIDLIGPLGSGFKITSNAFCQLVGGGMGSAPLKSLAEELKKRDNSLKILIGAANSDLLPPVSDLESLLGKEDELLISTDDGSRGHHGFVTDLLCVSDSLKHRENFIFACGPEVMLKKTADFAEDQGISCQVSLERRMACGSGVCLSCVLGIEDDEHDEGNCLARVCTEGPVFDSQEVEWDGNW